MLAAFGFTATGILLIFFARSLKPLLGKKNKAVSTNYRNAYMLVAATFILWGIACAIGNHDFLAMSVLLGDALLLIATLLLLELSYAQKWLWLVAIGGTALIVIRAFFFYPDPFIEGGILVFNSQRLVSFILTATFLLVWLPTNLRVADLIIRRSKLYDIRNIYVLLYGTSILAAVIFVLSKKPVTLALSFTAIGVCFLILTICNVLIKSAGARHAR